MRVVFITGEGRDHGVKYLGLVERLVVCALV